MPQNSTNSTFNETAYNILLSCLDKYYGAHLLKLISTLLVDCSCWKLWWLFFLVKRFEILWSHSFRMLLHIVKLGFSIRCCCQVLFKCMLFPLLICACMDIYFPRAASLIIFGSHCTSSFLSGNETLSGSKPCLCFTFDVLMNIHHWVPTECMIGLPSLTTALMASAFSGRFRTGLHGNCHGQGGLVHLTVSDDPLCLINLPRLGQGVGFSEAEIILILMQHKYVEINHKLNDTTEK